MAPDFYLFGMTAGGLPGHLATWLPLLIAIEIAAGLMLTKIQHRKPDVVPVLADDRERPLSRRTTRPPPRH